MCRQSLSTIVGPRWRLTTRIGDTEDHRQMIASGLRLDHLTAFWLHCVQWIAAPEKSALRAGLQFSA